METVYVKKATFDLRKGETMEMYLRQLRDELETKFAVPGTQAKNWEDSVWVCVRATEPGRAIFTRSGRGAKLAETEGLYSTDYTRNPDFTFTFATPTKVIEEVAFVPLQKSADWEQMLIPGRWEGLPL